VLARELFQRGIGVGGLFDIRFDRGQLLANGGNLVFKPRDFNALGAELRLGAYRTVFHRGRGRGRQLRGPGRLSRHGGRHCEAGRFDLRRQPLDIGMRVAIARQQPLTFRFELLNQRRRGGKSRGNRRLHGGCGPQRAGQLDVGFEQRLLLPRAAQTRFIRRAARLQQSQPMQPEACLIGPLAAAAAKGGELGFGGLHLKHRAVVLFGHKLVHRIEPAGVLAAALVQTRRDGRK